jgi:hypothetical protein
MIFLSIIYNNIDKASKVRDKASKVRDKASKVRENASSAGEAAMRKEGRWAIWTGY